MLLLQIPMDYLIPANFVGHDAKKEAELAVPFSTAFTVCLTLLPNANGEISVMYGNSRDSQGQAAWESLLARLMYKQYPGLLGEFL